MSVDILNKGVLKCRELRICSLTESVCFDYNSILLPWKINRKTNLFTHFHKACVCLTYHLPSGESKCEEGEV